MSDLFWFLAILALPLLGWFICRLPLVSQMDLGARLALASSTGWLAVSAVMFLLSLLQIPWSRTSVGLSLAPFVVAGFLPRNTPWSPRREGTGTARMLLAVLFILTVYGVASSRETCADLLYFWGPKANRFFITHHVDAEFLGFPHYNLMHPDYPPLVPITFAWASIVAHRFSWWGALLTTPLALLATVFAFRGMTRHAIGDDRAGRYAALLAALLGYGFARAMVAGAADPILLMFETIALTALTFGDDSRDWLVIAAVGIAGLLFTKVEGVAFAAILIAVYLVTRRRLRSAMVVVLPGALLLGGWLLFARHHHLIDQYARARSTMHPEQLGTVIRETFRRASYGAFWLPWFAAAAGLVFGRDWRRAAIPLALTAGLISSLLYFYLFYLLMPDPRWWIASSAERVLLSPLVCLLVASAASSE